MAVSMEHLQIRVARLSAITVDVIHLDPVVLLEEQSTIPTATVRRFEPCVFRSKVATDSG
jgi:hypothetical protein